MTLLFIQLVENGCHADYRDARKISLRSKSFVEKYGKICNDYVVIILLALVGYQGIIN